MDEEYAIELAKRAIVPCKGITLRALKKVIELAEMYVEEHKSCEKMPPMEMCLEIEKASQSTKNSTMTFK